ncbi:unnamed protein product [Sphagnum jensenii]|uniref:ACT domain-containing protein n=1 Tax=Sphagnum jensenii TaxID=128206 RepID=A0ABP0V5L5_9BRYO
MEQVVVAGVAADKDQVKFTLQNLVEQPGVAAQIFGALSASSIVVDVIVQDVPSNGNLTLSFTVGKGDHLKSRQILEDLQASSSYKSMKIVEEGNLAKSVSWVWNAASSRSCLKNVYDLGRGWREH